MRDKFLTWGAALVIFTIVIALLIRAHYWIPILLTCIYLLGVYNANQSPVEGRGAFCQSCAEENESAVFLK